MYMRPAQTMTFYLCWPPRLARFGPPLTTQPSQATCYEESCQVVIVCGSLQLLPTCSPKHGSYASATPLVILVTPRAVSSSPSSARGSTAPFRKQRIFTRGFEDECLA